MSTTFLNRANQKNFIGFAVIAIFLLLILNIPAKDVAETIQTVNIGGQNLSVIIADTAEERTQGLSGHPGLKDNEGMLFVFDEPGEYYFWMRGMNFAIDMIWISEDGRVVYIKKDARPEDHLSTFGPDVNAKYVLEVNSGFSDKYNLKVGDMVSFN